MDKRWWLQLGILTGVSLCTHDAFAAAIVDVSARWDTHLIGYLDSNFQPLSASLPAGITITCSTNMSVPVPSATGCSDTRIVNISSTTSPLETLYILSDSVMTIANGSGSAIPGYLAFTTDYSAYLPGGLGAQVTDPAQEIARYTSHMLGSGRLPGNIQISDSFITADSSCDVAVLGETLSPTHCGLLDPPQFSTTFYVPMPAGDDASFFYRILMTGTVLGVPEAVPVPEPAITALFGAGLAGAFALRRRARRHKAG